MQEKLEKLYLHAQDVKEDIEPKSVYIQRDGCDYQIIHPICSVLSSAVPSKGTSVWLELGMKYSMNLYNVWYILKKFHLKDIFHKIVL